MEVHEEYEQETTRDGVIGEVVVKYRKVMAGGHPEPQDILNAVIIDQSSELSLVQILANDNDSLDIDSITSIRYLDPVNNAYLRCNNASIKPDVSFQEFLTINKFSLLCHEIELQVFCRPSPP